MNTIANAGPDISDNAISVVVNGRKKQRQLRRMVGKGSQGVTEESLRSHRGPTKESVRSH